jgi:hypothetical protein
MNKSPLKDFNSDDHDDDDFEDINASPEETKFLIETTDMVQQGYEPLNGRLPVHIVLKPDATRESGQLGGWTRDGEGLSLRINYETPAEVRQGETIVIDLNPNRVPDECEPAGEISVTIIEAGRTYDAGNYLLCKVDLCPTEKEKLADYLSAHTMDISRQGILGLKVLKFLYDKKSRHPYFTLRNMMLAAQFSIATVLAGSIGTAICMRHDNREMCGLMQEGKDLREGSYSVLSRATNTPPRSPLREDDGTEFEKQTGLAKYRTLPARIRDCKRIKIPVSREKANASMSKTFSDSK